ncbi:hypothetical protein DRJ48_02575 [Candidatus Woesearchaeota archaeon]|nr:MAG: hypothetical protein DRJ48_02575 [Candidatus Woesearchaeota archaeon]
MEFCVVTSKGLEGVCSKELQRLFGGCKLCVEPGIVLLELNTKNAIKTLYTRVHSAHYIFQIFSKLELIDNWMEGVAKSPDLKELLSTKTFAVECIPRSQELEREIGARLVASLKGKARVDLRNPEIKVCCTTTQRWGIIGVDWEKRKLSKRAYRVFTTRHSLNSVSGFALGFNVQDSAVFLVTGDGTPLIETCLYLNKIPLSKQPLLLQHTKPSQRVVALALNSVLLRGAKQNATLAGVRELIEWVEIPWQQGLQTLSKSFKNLVVALNFVREAHGTPSLSIFKGVCGYTSHVLLKGGFIAVLVLAHMRDGFKDIARGYGYKLFEEIEFMQGGLALSILRFRT